MIPEAGMDVGGEADLRQLLFSGGSYVSNSDDSRCAIWRSIRLLDNSQVILGRTTIKDAYYGVENVGVGTNLILFRANFENNFVGAYLRNDIATNFIGGNIFSFDGTLDPIGNLPYDFPFTPTYNIQRAFTGVQTDGVVLNTTPLNDNQPFNEFINLGNGIFLHDSDANINWCTFEDMDPGPYNDVFGNGILFDSDGFNTMTQFGLGVDHPQTTFNNCRTGIRTTARGLWFTSRIVGTTVWKT